MNTQKEQDYGYALASNTPEMPGLKRIEKILNSLISLQDSSANRDCDLKDILDKISRSSETLKDKQDYPMQDDYLSSIESLISKIDYNLSGIMDSVKKFNTIF